MHRCFRGTCCFCHQGRWKWRTKANTIVTTAFVAGNEKGNLIKQNKTPTPQNPHASW